MDYNLNPAQIAELLSLYDACKNHNAGHHVSRGMTFLAEQLVTLGYATKTMTSVGKYKYRHTDKGEMIVRQIRGQE